MKKSTLLLLGIITLLILINGALIIKRPKLQPPKQRIYTNLEQGYTIKIPSGYQICKTRK